MNSRLREIINYKTGGRQNPFAELLGWSPQYLAKLLKGENFGLSPVLTLLSTFPEINARWFLFGEGSMLEAGRLFELQRESMSHIMSLLDLDKYIPYMSGEEVREFEEAVQSGRKPDFSPDTVAKWQSLLDDRNRALDARFAEAKAKSDELCRQKTAK
ncbi:hypothetical protein [Muribaculum intestinale]|jgi:hypothetical protein|uniref:hypothetical protein n=1 Tax=Muribaculum intestinale TaxID=1796646 RepID=UPI0025B6B23F|nr:hypothetical protein [Muribaculum intestinale]